MEVPGVQIREADPAEPAGAALVAAMEAEIERLYGDRSGSIHAVSASPGEMRRPGGAFLLVLERGEPIGCGGLKRLDGGSCEIKRMYLLPGARGRGLSRTLLEALEGRALDLGYLRVRLDTGDRQPSALRLYTSAGYVRIADYNGNPLAAFWFEKEL